MKNLKKLGILLLTTIFLNTFSSCSKDDDGGSGGTAAEGIITAKVDGTTVSTEATLTTGEIYSTSEGAFVIDLNGANTAGKSYDIIIHGYEGVGSYEIGGTNSSFVAGYYSEFNNTSGTQTWSVGYGETVAGQLQIVSATSTKIIGTFYFTAKNTEDNTTKTISEGSFNVNLTTF